LAAQLGDRVLMLRLRLSRVAEALLAERRQRLLLPTAHHLERLLMALC
jgi:hypothetical protein